MARGQIDIYELIQRITGVPMRGVMRPSYPYILKQLGPRKLPEPGLNRSKKLEGKLGSYDGRLIRSRYQ